MDGRSGGGGHAASLYQAAALSIALLLYLRLSTACPPCLPPFRPHQIQLPDPRVVRLVQNLSKEQLDLPPAVLVLNKCELVPREQRPALLTLADSLRQDHPFEETFWISALKGVWLPG